MLIQIKSDKGELHYQFLVDSISSVHIESNDVATISGKVVGEVHEGTFNLSAEEANRVIRVLHGIDEMKGLR